MSKGMSQAMWIVISLVVLLIVALTVVVIFTTGSSNFKESILSIFGITEKSIDLEMCNSLCDTCKMTHGSDCSDKWDDLHGEDCASFECV